MATRQYIGARYVPKFYTNSVDGSAAWESNVVYEPLTYVTLTNGHMYISKKQVPATVGTPASNAEYWLDIGSYNGFIDNLQQQINALVTDVNAKANMASIAPVEDGDDTIGDYSAGDEFYRNGVLYKAKTTIAANTAFSSLTLNTDYEAADPITEQISDLANQMGDFINPDSFTGTDSQKLQAAFDYFLPDKSGNIIINRTYTLDDDLTIGYDTNNNRRNYVNVIGLGETSIINSNGHVIQGQNAITNGGIHWKNIFFNGRFDPNNRYDTCFDVTYLTRMFFDNCKFSEYLKVISGTYGQSLYFTNCYFSYNTDCIYFDNSNGQMNDFHIDTCIFEKCTHLYNVNSTFRTYVLIITNSLIENFYGTAIKLGNTVHQLIFTDNYLEDIPVVIDAQECTAIYKVLIANTKFNTPTSGNAQYLVLLPNTEYVPYTQLSKWLSGIIENNIVSTSLGYICSFGSLTNPTQPIRWKVINNIGDTDTVLGYLYDYQDTIDGTITFPGSITDDGSFLRKSKNSGLVTFQYTVATPITGATPQNIGSIPLRFAPKNNLYVNMYSRSGGTEYARATISPNGNIGVTGAGGSITNGVDTFIVSYFAREDYNQ